jgi:hypothetical protein
MDQKDQVRKKYWVVSPNVRNNEATVSDWRQASRLGHAAFMGWKTDDRDHKKIGYKFAHVIKPGDVILIARRRKHQPEIVGFGVVDGEYHKRLKTIKTPESFGSLRRLSPFVPQSTPPVGIPVLAALRHTTALALLHPSTNKDHERLCKWLDMKLVKKERTKPGRPSDTDHNQSRQALGPFLAELPHNDQLDFKYRAHSQIIHAKKFEAELMQRYCVWLQQQERKLQIAKYRKLQCDGFEKAYRNLIEAKSSAKREHIRMAVGQLLDYAFQGRKKFGWPNMAILIPEEPHPDVQEWLKHLKISLIWPKKDVFLDNANGQFT